jgi:hypothetical protein
VDQHERRAVLREDDAGTANTRSSGCALARIRSCGDAKLEHDIYADDAICDYPQSGERILGRNNLQALRSHHPGKPSGFKVKRVLGSDNLWITEYTIVYQGRSAFTVSIMEFRNGKVVHETQYFADPFEAPAWRSQWVVAADG